MKNTITLLSCIIESGKEMKTYKIIRFRFKGSNRVMQRGLTLKEAEEHCNDPSTSGDGWFDGYEEE